MNDIYYDCINIILNETMITAVKNALMSTSFIVVAFIMYKWYQEVKKEPENASFEEKAINSIDTVTNKHMGKRFYLITFITYGILLIINLLISKW